MDPIETRAVTRIVEGLAARGWHTVHANDGGDDYFPVRTVQEVIDAIDGTGYATITFRGPDGKRGGVFFVAGNGEDVVCDAHCCVPLDGLDTEED